MAATSRFAMATHILLSLALEPDEEGKLVSSTFLASSLNTNPVVVRRLLGDLQRAGLVETQAGRSGGAKLRRSVDKISLGDIYSAIGREEIFAYNPNDPNRHCPLSCEMKNVLEPVFQSANEALEKNLAKVKLGDLSRRMAKACQKEASKGAT